MEAEKLTEIVIGAAITVHRTLGPGLLESAYRKCLVYELGDRGLSLAVEKPLPIQYGLVQIDCAYKLDIVVNDKLILELKAVERIDRVHIAQLLTYMKLTGVSIGLLLNFNVVVMKDGIRRLWNTK